MCGGGGTISVCLGHVMELMKLAQALLSYTKTLMSSFLTGHSSPAGEAILKPARVLFQKIRFMARSIPCLILTITQDRVSLAYTVALIPPLMAQNRHHVVVRMEVI